LDTWPLALLIVTLPILRRCFAGIMNPTPAHVQGTVKFSLVSLVVLNASVCLLVCPWYWAVGILLLLLPTLLLSRWVAMT
jgi:hypothetical protein